MPVQRVVGSFTLQLTCGYVPLSWVLETTTAELLQQSPVFEIGKVDNRKRCRLWEANFSCIEMS